MTSPLEFSIATSREKVENVVKPPMTPVVRKSRPCCGKPLFTAQYSTITPWRMNPDVEAQRAERILGAEESCGQNIDAMASRRTKAAPQKNKQKIHVAASLVEKRRQQKARGRRARLAPTASGRNAPVQ
jgi:hypothetical protein